MPAETVQLEIGRMEAEQATAWLREAAAGEAGSSGAGPNGMAPNGMAPNGTGRNGAAPNRFGAGALANGATLAELFALRDGHPATGTEPPASTGQYL